LALDEVAVGDARTTEAEPVAEKEAFTAAPTFAVAVALAELDVRARVTLDLVAVGRTLDTTAARTAVELVGVTATGLWMAAPRDGATAVKTATAETKIAVLIWTIVLGRGV